MKQKKLYYIPGLISIIGLPILLLFWGPPALNMYNIVRLNIPSYAKDTPGVVKFTEEYVYNYLANKKLIILRLDGYAWDEKSLSYKNDFTFADKEIERLQSGHDTTKALAIHLGNQNVYGDFVWLCNEALIYNIIKHAFVENNFYFFPNPPPASVQESYLPDLTFQIDPPPGWKPPTKWQTFKENAEREYYTLKYWLSDYFDFLFYRQKQNKILAAGFILLIAIPSIVKIKKYRKIKCAYHLRTELSA
jgi:hypothetical protein